MKASPLFFASDLAVQSGQVAGGQALTLGRHHRSVVVEHRGHDLVAIT